MYMFPKIVWQKYVKNERSEQSGMGQKCHWHCTHTSTRRTHTHTYAVVELLVLLLRLHCFWLGLSLGGWISLPGVAALHLLDNP